MTTTQELAAVHAARRPTAYVRTTRTLTRSLVVMALWYLGTVLVLAVATVAVMVAVAEPTVSVVQFGRQSSAWFPFAIAVITVAAYLPAHVAAGMTREVFVRAALTAAVLLAIFYAVVFTAVTAVETAVYDAAGWQQMITDAGWFTEDAGDLGVVLLGQLVTIAVAQASGYLVAVVYQRVGGWWGTLALPLTAGPVLGVIALLSRWVEGDWLAPPARWAAAVAVGLATAAAFAVLARRFQMKPASS